MKNLFLVQLILFSVISSSCWGETTYDLVMRDGLYYKRFTDVPFTGKVTQVPEEIMTFNGEYRDGKREGEWLIYYDNGQLLEKVNVKNGKLDGEHVWYYDNGQLRGKQNYKNGGPEDDPEYYTKDGTQVSNFDETFE